MVEKIEQGKNQLFDLTLVFVAPSPDLYLLRISTAIPQVHTCTFNFVAPMMHTPHAQHNRNI